MRRVWVLSILVGSAAYQNATCAKSLDLSLGMQGTSFPKSFSTFIESGLSLVFWGQAHTPSPFYGFLRVAGRLQSSAIINKAEYKVDVFPVSFLGMTAGRSVSYRTSFFNDNDCPTTADCGGWLIRNFLTLQSALKYRSLFLIGRYRHFELYPSITSGVFWDEGTDLIGAIPSDTANFGDLILGVRLKNGLTTGLALVTGKMTRERSAMNNRLIFMRYTREHFMIQGGGGLYHSSVHGDGAFVGLGMTWMPAPSPALF